MEAELSDSSNFGMAKSFVMMGQEQGFDMTTQEGMNKFMLAYNASLLAGREAAGEYAPSLAPPPGPYLGEIRPKRPVPTSRSGPLRHRKKKLAKAKRAASKAKAKQRNRKGK